MVATKGETGRGYGKQFFFYVAHGKNVMSAQMLEVSLLGIGTVLRLEKGCVVNGRMTTRKASNK